MRQALEIRGVSMNFGGIRALSEVDLRVAEGSITALIGPNGAGKTTLFNCVTGIYTPAAGDILILPPDASGGDDTINITGKSPDRITRLGLARTFQNIRLFANMTVLENVMTGMHCRTHAGLLAALLRPRGARLEERRIADASYELLRAVNLHQFWKADARSLPYGGQRRLEIARALASQPFLLCLDEPAAGMNPQETHALRDLVLSLRERYKLSILLIEHDMGMVMRLSDEIHVLEYGAAIARGTPDEVRADPAVIRAYLGEEGGEPRPSRSKSARPSHDNARSADSGAGGGHA